MTLDEFMDSIEGLSGDALEERIQDFLDAYEGDDKELIEPDLWALLISESPME